jgi:hypothetical protein
VKTKVGLLKNRNVGASDSGAGHSFLVLFGFHLGFTIFPFFGQYSSRWAEWQL